MKQIISSLLATSMLVQGCAGRTTITSQPSGAKVFIDGMQVGQTPYRYSDTKIIGSQTSVTLEKPGYQTLNTSFNRDEQLHVGALVGGLFVWPLLLWVTTYKDNHHYTLAPQGAQRPAEPQTAPTPPAASTPADSPAAETPDAPSPAPIQPAAKSKAERLRELDSLKAQKLISDQEYSTQRQKILDEP